MNLPAHEMTNFVKMKAALTENQWKVIDEIIDILEPVYQLMLKMQTDAHTLSDFFGTWIMIRAKLSRSTANLTDLSNEMVTQMDGHIDDLQCDPLMTSAIYIDPRYSRSLKPVQRDVVRRTLRLFNESLDKLNARAQDQDIIMTDIEIDTYLNSLGSNSLNEKSHESAGSAKANEVLLESNLEFELEMNAFEQNCQKQRNIIKYWNSLRTKYPKLYEVAKIVFSVPSSQTNVQRSISSFTYTINSHRTPLSAKTLEHILLIRCNPELFKEMVREELELESV